MIVAKIIDNFTLMAKLSSLLLLLFVSSWLTSCDNSAQSAPDPFTTSTMWIYSSTSYDAGGNPTLSTDTLTIKSSRISDSKKYLTFSDDSYGTLEANGSDWVLKELNPMGAICSLVQIPPHVGDTISKIPSVPTKLDGKVVNATLSMYVKDVNIATTVVVGTFSCIVIELDLTSVATTNFIKELQYISPSHGVVLRESYTVDSKTGTSKLLYRSQLTSLK